MEHRNKRATGDYTAAVKAHKKEMKKADWLDEVARRDWKIEKLMELLLHGGPAPAHHDLLPPMPPDRLAYRRPAPERPELVHNTLGPDADL